MVESESFLDSTRRMVERGFLPSAESSVWRLKDGCGGVEGSDGWGGVGKRLLDGLGNG